MTEPVLSGVEYPPPSVITEAELMTALGGPSLLARPCACGSVVVADPRDPAEGVSLHNGTPEHRSWRVWGLGD